MKKIINYLKERKEKKRKKKEEESRKKRIIKTIIWTVAYIALVAVLVWGTPRALKYYLNTEYPMAAITSRSMWPVLYKGDLVFIQGVYQKEDISIDDIVVFTNAKGVFTIHRVIELGEDTLTTKGDANNVPDNPIQYKNVIGKLYKIGNWNARLPKLGFISTSASKYR